MKTFLDNRWDALRSSFWFVPSVMSMAALLLAVLSPTLDSTFGPWIANQIPWIGVSASAARVTLSAIGSAMVSVAGIVFSVMIVALSIVSSQYGSRLLRTFMSDGMTQLELGTMLATNRVAINKSTLTDFQNELTSDVTSFALPMSFGRIDQRKRLLDNRSHFVLIDQFLEGSQVRATSTNQNDATPFR